MAGVEPKPKTKSKSNRETKCRCNKCKSHIFYRERSKKTISFGMTKDVCPKCGGSFTVVDWENKGLMTEGDKFLFANPNNDVRIYLHN